MKRVDSNHAEITKALRKIGATVISLADVHHGCGDILVGLAGRNYLLELKDGSKSPSRQKLTPDQEIFHANWGGQIAVVNSVDAALEVVTMRDYTN